MPIDRRNVLLASLSLLGAAGTVVLLGSNKDPRALVTAPHPSAIPSVALPEAPPAPSSPENITPGFAAMREKHRPAC